MAAIAVQENSGTAAVFLAVILRSAEDTGPATLKVHLQLLQAHAAPLPGSPASQSFPPTAPWQDPCNACKS